MFKVLWALCVCFYLSVLQPSDKEHLCVRSRCLAAAKHRLRTQKYHK